MTLCPNRCKHDAFYDLSVDDLEKSPLETEGSVAVIMKYTLGKLYILELRIVV